MTRRANEGQEGKNYWVILFVTGKLLFKFSWAGGLGGGRCCGHSQTALLECVSLCLLLSAPLGLMNNVTYKMYIIFKKFPRTSVSHQLLLPVIEKNLVPYPKSIMFFFFFNF